MPNLYKMLTLICLTSINMVSHSACAADAPAPAPFIGQYDFTWAGIRLGKLELSMEEGATDYKLRLAVTSAGIVNWFTHHESDTEVKGLHTAKGYQPLYYESNYKTKKKPRHIRLQYTKDGTNTEVLNEPAEDRTLRPEVKPELRNGSFDPLSALMVLRSDQLTIPAFDAKRFYEVKATDVGKETMAIIGKDTETQHYTLARTPLGGLTEKEKTEYKNGEPPLHFYLSTDARHVPVYMTMPILMGSVKGILIKECSTWDECKVK